jgi:putative ABC transport system substrate-binding protein
LLLWAPLAAKAQESTTIRRIGVLWPVLDDPTLEAFRQGLHGRGYVEGQNIAMEYRYAQGKMISSLISRAVEQSEVLLDALAQPEKRQDSEDDHD